ncbi:sensor histidine kinase [Brevibacillus ginsengisoli]|uniref:sensor histidine kinase n=1 Tax=Brevibacillus ginsengisoli TaxID=363854 RepID=UPI003CEB7E93
MFEKTRKKLTLMYSGMLAFILLTIFLGFYFTLSTIVTRNEQSQLDNVAAKTIHEWDEYQKRIRMHVQLPGIDKQDKIDFDYLQQNQIAMIVTEQNQLIAGNPHNDSSLLEQIQTSILQDAPEEGQINYLPMTLDAGAKIYAVYRPQANKGDDTRFYLAEDVTWMEQLLHQMKWILSIAGVILLALTSLVGYWFAGRAMVPINLSYKRQKEFTTDASHELRTPLSVILSSTEILQEKKESLPPFHQTVLQNMVDEIHRMIRLIEHLLTLSRSDFEKDSNRMFDSFDFRCVVREVTERMQIAGSLKGVSVVNQDEQVTQPVNCHGDIDSIRQLLYILLDNAVKYSEAGGTVEVHVTTESNHRLICTVRDHGCGIPEEDLPYVFERFYRADKSRSREVEGTGLGLSIADQIVKTHKGQISVTSSKEKGTVFTVILPINKTRGR